jgi:DNA-binding Lrp family transcriptional regulator
MGAFRDYFNGLYNTYLKTPLMEVQNRVYELKGTLEGKLSDVTERVGALSNQVGETGNKITTGLITVIKENEAALRSAAVTLSAPIKDVADIMLGFIPLYKVASTVKTLKEAHSKEELDSIWDAMDVVVKENVLAVKAYNAVSKELQAQGLGTPADLACGYIGEQIAKAVWKIEAAALPNIMGWIDSFAEGYNMPKSDMESMKKLANAGEFGLNAVVNFMLGVTLYPAVMSAGEPAWVKMRQEAYKKLPVTLLDPRTLVSLKYKEYIPDGLYRDQFGKLGFSDEMSGLLEKDFLFYPAPVDFIRFAVRETFKPDVVKEYGYDNDFPSAMIPYAKKAGMSEEWLRHYWRAHWEIPSPRQGYEMLHRGVIDQASLEGLLKIGDYAPGWIQPLIDISYNPITRVDLRRLYADGVIDETRVYSGYLELGYSAENAGLITAWVVKSTQVEDRELTKAEVLKSFRIDETSKEQAIKFLGLIGYSAEDAAFVISFEEHRMYEEDRKEEIETVIAELIAGKHTVDEVKTRLGNMDVSIKQSNSLIQKAERIIRKRFTLPSKDDCIRWLEANIIDEGVFTSKMVALHYLDEDIKRFVEEVKGKK